MRVGFALEIDRVPCEVKGGLQEIEDGEQAKGFRSWARRVD